MATITVHLQARSSYDAQYLIELGNILSIVTVPTTKQKHRITEYRHAINKALHLNNSQYRFRRNVRVNGKWLQEWETI
jgi:hypothetical protein